MAAPLGVGGLGIGREFDDRQARRTAWSLIAASPVLFERLVFAAGTFQFRFALVERVFQLVDVIFLTAELALEQFLISLAAFAAGET